MIGWTVATDNGRYKIVRCVFASDNRYERLRLYIGHRESDGQYALLASVDASIAMSVVGNDDPAKNYATWNLISRQIDVRNLLQTIQRIDLSDHDELYDQLRGSYCDADRVLVVTHRSDYDKGDVSHRFFIESLTTDTFDAIAENWNKIGSNVIIMRGFEDRLICHLAPVPYDIWQTYKLNDCATYYVADYDDGKDDADSANWVYYTENGHRLAKEEVFDEEL